jgi:ABC-type glutathione transport system ATPase component
VTVGGSPAAAAGVTFAAPAAQRDYLTTRGEGNDYTVEAGRNRRFGETAEATLTPAATEAPHGVRIDVHELSRQIRVRNRGDLTALDAVSFTLSAGELVAIVGPSGAGKTTLLEAIAGIAPAT